MNVQIDILSIEIPDLTNGQNPSWILPETLEVCRFVSLLGRLTSDAVVGSRYITMYVYSINDRLKAISETINGQNPSSNIMHQWGHQMTDFRGESNTVAHHTMNNLWLFGQDQIIVGGSGVSDSWTELTLWVEVIKRGIR